MRLVRIACWTVIAACLACQGHAASAGDSYLDALRGEVDEPTAPASSDDSEEDSHAKPRSGRNGRSADHCRDRDHRPAWSFSMGSSSHEDEEITA